MTLLLESACIGDSSIGKCPQRLDPHGSTWNNSFVDTALQLDFSTCSLLPTHPPHRAGPQRLPRKLLVLISISESAAGEPVGDIGKQNRQDTCSHKAWGLALSLDPPLFLAKDKLRTSSPVGGAHFPVATAFPAAIIKARTELTLQLAVTPICPINLLWSASCPRSLCWC